MEKTAILVLGAHAPRILDRAVGMLDDPRIDIFFHLDAKTDWGWYRDRCPALERVTVVEPRIDVFWGGFTMIEAELILLRRALADPAIGRVVLVSDDAVPVRRADAIHQSLVETPDRLGLEISEQAQGWYDGFFLPDTRFTALRQMDVNLRYFTDADWENIRALEEFRQRGKQKLAVHFGRQWWSMGRDTAETLLRRIDEDDHLRESFRYSLFSDETFFPTIYRLCFPDTVIPDVPMFADYSGFPVPWNYGGPWELENVRLQPGHLFLRKVRPDSLNVVDEIESWLSRPTDAAQEP